MFSTLVNKLHAFLTLGRVSNLPTVWTNCLAAWVLNRLGQQLPLFELPNTDAAQALTFQPEQWIWIFLGASLLYIAGTTLNDAFDEEYDRQYNRDRPIPAGILKCWEVWAVGFIQLVSGAAILYFKSGVSEIYLGMLCMTILAYDAVHKKWAGSVLLMGGCRLFLWWTIATAGLDIAHELSPLVLVWSMGLLLYIAGITFVARGEATGNLPAVPWPFMLLFVQVLLGLFFCVYTGRWITLVLVILLAYGIWIGVLRAQLKGRHIGRGVALWLALITLGDALAMGLVAPTWGLFALLGFPLSIMMQKKFPAT
jgi:4-hydroxybenzoate polyprenyltransferase